MRYHWGVHTLFIAYSFFPWVLSSPVGEPVGAIEHGVEEVMESWTHHLQSTSQLSSESDPHAPASPMHGSSSNLGLEQSHRRIEAEDALARLLDKEGMLDPSFRQRALFGLLQRVNNKPSSESDVRLCKSSFLLIA